MKTATGLANVAAGFLMAATAAIAGADTIYVNGSCGDDDWSGTGRVCSAPDGPKRTIRAGIRASQNGDTVIVADAIYTGFRNKNLEFAGKRITVRSENGPDNCIIDCQDDGRGFYFHNGETPDAVLDGFTIRNGHVFRESPGEWFGGAILCTSANPTILNCVLADNEAFEGGGIFNHASDPLVAHCTFSGNFALRGGGMSNSSSDPTVTDCIFTDNSTENGSSSRGGGMYNWDHSNPAVTDCTFTNNTTYFHGGGICNWSSSAPTMTNCTFSGNSAGQRGGGLYNRHSDSTVTNCSFIGNSAGLGGGMYNLDSPLVIDCAFGGNSGELGGGMFNLGSPKVINCAFEGNSARDGGGMYNLGYSKVTNTTFRGNSAKLGGGMYNNRYSRVTNSTFVGNSADSGTGIYNAATRSAPMVSNCIFWNDGPDQIVDANGAVTTVRFSDVRGGWPGEGNIDADPRFVDPAHGDYRLAPGSPCIDAADNTAVPSGIRTDLDGYPRFVDDPATPDCQWLPGTCGDPPIADMGAYEFPSRCQPCDVNCDGQINAFDIEPFLDLLFGGDPPCNTCAGDANRDGSVNAADIEPLLDCLFQQR